MHGINKRLYWVLDSNSITSLYNRQVNKTILHYSVFLFNPELKIPQRFSTCYESHIFGGKILEDFRSNHAFLLKNYSCILVIWILKNEKDTKGTIRSEMLKETDNNCIMATYIVYITNTKTLCIIYYSSITRMVVNLSYIYNVTFQINCNRKLKTSVQNYTELQTKL